MREVLRGCRAILSEWRLQPSEWPRIIKIVQMILNHSPSPSLGGVAPITAMTGLKAMSPMGTFIVPGAIEVTTLTDIKVKQKTNFDTLQRALDNMHRQMKAANERARKRCRHAHDKKRGTAIAQFDVGDVVLYVDVWQHTREKLRVKWCGPAQITSTVSNWIFEIQNLVTGTRKEAHASRLKFYANSSLEVNEDLRLHAAQNSEGHVVDSLLESR